MEGRETVGRGVEEEERVRGGRVRRMSRKEMDSRNCENIKLLMLYTQSNRVTGTAK